MPENLDTNESVAGDDNTVIGTPPARMGSGNTIINSGVSLNRGGLAVGRGARADATSVAIGAGAGGGAPALAPLLGQLADLMRAEGNTDGAECASDLVAHVQSAQPDVGRIARLWAKLEILGTTEDVTALVARIVPVIHRLLR